MNGGGFLHSDSCEPEMRPLTSHADLYTAMCSVQDPGTDHGTNTPGKQSSGTNFSVGLVLGFFSKCLRLVCEHEAI